MWNGWRIHVKRVSFRDVRGFRCVHLIVSCEKSISLNPLHAVSFIASCRVMASIKENPDPSAIPLSMPRKRFQASFLKKVTVPRYAKSID